MKSVKITILCFSISTILVYGYTGFFSVMRADDYCSAYIAQDKGLFGAQHYWYTHWSGRYAATLLDTVFGFADPAVYSFVPVIVLALLMLSLYAASTKLGVDRLTSAAAAAFLVASLLTIVPDIRESLFWGQGMRSLIPSLILFPLLFVVSNPITALLLAFVTGGFSETFAAVQVVLLAVLIWRYEEKRKLLIFAFLGALLALAVVMLSPGNAIRKAEYPPTPGILDLARITISSTLIFVLPQLITRFFQLAALAIFGAVFLHSYFSSAAGRWAFLSVLLIVPVALFPAAFAMAKLPPPRTWIIPDAILASGVLLGASSLRVPKQKLINAFLLSLVFLVLLSNFLNAFTGMEFMRQYAADWHAGTSMIQAAVQAEQPSVEIPWKGFDGIQPGAVDDFKPCLSNYYHIQIQTARN